MINLDSFNGTWLERPLQGVICAVGDPVTEAQTKCKDQLPSFIKVPASKGGKTRPVGFGR